MSDYGILSGIVYGAGIIVAAGTAIALAWIREAKWLPPQEDLPGSTRRVSALLTGVIVALLFVFEVQIGATVIGAVTVICLILALLALLLCVYVNSAFSFFIRSPNQPEVRILGGYALTAEAARVQREFGLSGQPLFDNAHWEPDLVWTAHSRAITKVLSTVGFVVLISCGSIGLGAAALLLRKFVSDDAVSTSAVFDVYPVTVALGAYSL